MSEYRGYVLFTERGGWGQVYHSALSRADYEAANQGEFRIPYRETSRRAIKALIDKREAENEVCV